MFFTCSLRWHPSSYNLQEVAANGTIPALTHSLPTPLWKYSSLKELDLAFWKLPALKKAVLRTVIPWEMPHCNPKVWLQSYRCTQARYNPGYPSQFLCSWQATMFLSKLTGTGFMAWKLWKLGPKWPWLHTLLDVQTSQYLAPRFSHRYLLNHWEWELSH